MTDERLPPQDLDAERALLGSMCLSREAIGDVLPIIGKADVRWFYRPDHRILFETLADLYDQNVEIDLVVVRDELTRRESLKEVGGAEYLTSCAMSVPSHLHARRYATIVRDKGIDRDIIGACHAIIEEAYAGLGELPERIDRAEAALYAATRLRHAKSSRPVADIAEDVERSYDDATAPMAIATGHAHYDALMGGLFPTELTILSAWSSVGKSALALQWGWQIARSGVPVEVYSLEMGEDSIVHRKVCAWANVQVSAIRRRALNEYEHDRFRHALHRMRSVPINIDDSGGTTITDMRTKLRRAASHHGTFVAIVDYLQLIRDPSNAKAGREREIASIAQGLKDSAKELSIPIVALCQLNEDGALRESRAIEQHADVWLRLRRPAWEEARRTRCGESVTPSTKFEDWQAFLQILKNRQGPTGGIALRWCAESMEYHEIEPDRNQPEVRLPDGPNDCPF